MLAREVGLFFAVVLKDLWGPVDDSYYDDCMRRTLSKYQETERKSIVVNPVHHSYTTNNKKETAKD